MIAIDFIIEWSPIICFAIILLIGFIFGIIGGLRKSIISVIHTIIALAISIGVYFVFVNVTYFDTIILDTVKSIAPTFLTDMGVSSDVTTFKEALMQIIPKLAETDQSLSMAISSNANYLLGLVNVAYSLVFATISTILFFVLKLILFLIYLIFYPEWRYINKCNTAYNNNKAKAPYQKKSLMGGLVGVCCAILVGVFCFSFTGNVLYALAGTGEGVLPEHTFESEDTNEAYAITRKIEGYGKTGLFKLFNSVKDDKGVPLYLHMTGFIFSGEYENAQTGNKEKFYLTHELGNYTSFLYELSSVVVKHDKGTIDNLIHGSETFSTEVLIDYFSDANFRSDLRDVLENNATKSSFVSDFIFSMVDSYAQNIDKSSIADSFSPEVKEILSILFVEGYKSDLIEFEKNYSGEDVFPYIKPSYLIDKNDLLVAYDIFSSLVDKGIFDPDADVVDVALSITPYIQNLHMFHNSNNNRVAINGVMGRIFSFLEQHILGVDTAEAFYNYESNIEIKWIEEIVKLANLSTDINTFYGVINTGVEQSKKLSTIVSELANNSDTLLAYDKVVDYLTNSKLAGVVLSKKFVNDFIAESFTSISPNFVMPANLSLTNKYSTTGDLVEYGELHKVLSAIRNFAVSPQGPQFIEEITTEGADVVLSIKNAKQAFVSKNQADKSVIDYLEDSDLLHSLASCFLTDFASKEGSIIYLSNNVFDSNGLIKRSEFNLILDNLFNLLDIVPDNFDFTQEYAISKLLKQTDNLFINPTINLLLKDSAILQGTVAKLLIDFASNGELGADFITLTTNLRNPENWIKTETKQSELYVTFTAIANIIGNSKDLADVDESYINDLLNLLTNDSKMSALYSSELLRFSFSGIILNALTSCGLFNDNIIQDCIEDDVISKDEALALVSTISYLNLDIVSGDFSTIDAYINDLSKIVDVNGGGEEFAGHSLLDVAYESLIFKDFFNVKLDSALLTLLDNDKLNSVKVDGYYTINELKYFINSLTELDLNNIASGGAEDLWDSNVIDKFTTLNNCSVFDTSITKLDYVYNSKLVAMLVTQSVDQTIDNNPSVMQHHPDSKEIINGITLYKKNEISQLIKLLSLLNTDSVSNISADNLLLKDVFEQLFDNDKKVVSNLIHAVLSKNVNSIPSSQLIKPNDIYLESYADLVLINHFELFTLLDFSVNTFGDTATIKELSSNMSNSINEFKISNIKESYFDSRIILSTLTDLLNNVTSIIIPDKAYYDQISLKKDEIISLFDICAELSVDKIADIQNVVIDKVEHLSLSQASYFIEGSSIVHATVSDKIIATGGLVIPKYDLIKNGDNFEKVDVTSISIEKQSKLFINIFELTRLFNALSSMGVQNVAEAYEVDVDALNPSSYYNNKAKRTAVASSVILRATITENINLGSNQVIALLDEVVYEDLTDVNGNVIAVLKDYEIDHLLIDVGLFNSKNYGNSVSSNPFKCELTYDLIIQINQAGDLHDMLQSDIFRLGVSKILHDKHVGTITYTEVSVYILGEHDATTTSYSCSAQDIEDLFAKLN